MDGLTRLTRFAVDHPIWTLAAVLLISLAFAIPIASITQETDFREFLSDDDPIIQLLDQAEARYGRTLGIMVMLYNDQGIYNEATLDKIDRLQTAFEKLPGVKSVTTALNSQVITGSETSLSVRFAAPGGEAPQTPEEMAAFEERISGSRMLEGNVVSSDGKATSINVELEVGADEYALTPQIQEITARMQGGGDELYLYGDAYFDALMSEEMEGDLTTLFPLALGLMILVLFGSFMQLRGVLIPIGVVLLSIIVAMGVMGLFGLPLTMVSFIAPVLLLAIGIADGIHVLNRYNEEVRRAPSKRDAILNTMAEMKGPVVMT
jgi:predicted RND superfamily exporter protein